MNQIQSKLIKRTGIINRHENLVENVCIYIQQHCTAGINVNTVAYHFNVDPSYLNKIFRASIGVTPKEFINQKMCEHFDSLLKEGFVFAFEVYDRLGFPSEDALYHWVKRTYGKSFSKVKDEILNNYSHAVGE